MVIGQMFRVNESRLPKHYRNKQIMFLIVNEDQNINADGTWTTKISGQMHLYPGEAKKLENKKYIEEAPEPEYQFPLHQMPNLASGEHYRTDCTGKTYIVAWRNTKYVVKQGKVPVYDANGRIIGERWSNGPDISCDPNDWSKENQMMKLKRKPDDFSSPSAPELSEKEKKELLKYLENL